MSRSYFSTVCYTIHKKKVKIEFSEQMNNQWTWNVELKYYKLKIHYISELMWQDGMARVISGSSRTHAAVAWWRENAHSGWSRRQVVWSHLMHHPCSWTSDHHAATAAVTPANILNTSVRRSLKPGFHYPSFSFVTNTMIISIRQITGVRICGVALTPSPGLPLVWGKRFLGVLVFRWILYT